MDGVVSLLRDLVAINSINPTLAGGPGEGELARWCAERLRRLQLEPEFVEAAPGRPSVVARVPGRGEARPVLLNAHLDTVGVEDMAAPFALRQEGDRLYGRGSYDMKGSIAIMLALAERFAHIPPPGDVWLTLVADEEDLSIGSEAVVRNWLPKLENSPAAAIVLEPTEEGIGIAHKGFAWFEVEVRGRAAHGSRPLEGIDAIVPLGPGLVELARLGAELAALPADPLLERPSLHVSTIAGGTAWSVYPAAATLRWERRTLPGEDEERLPGELERVLAVVRAALRPHERLVEAADGTSAGVEGREIFRREPLGTSADAALVRAFRSALPDAPVVGLPFWTDGALFSAAGLPTVIYGPIGHGAHALDEWVSASSLERVTATMRALIAAGDWE